MSEIDPVKTWSFEFTDFEEDKYYSEDYGCEYFEGTSEEAHEKAQKIANQIETEIGGCIRLVELISHGRSE
jgi:hypothetical protein